MGCGDQPHPNAFACGDLHLGRTKHRARGTGRVIHPKKLKNFVLFDAHYLPFKDRSFDVVYASHVLEHLENPIFALKDWGRVAKTVDIIVPDGRGVQECDSEAHLYTWTHDSLENLLRRVFNEVRVYDQAAPLLWFRSGFLPLIFNFIVRRLLWRFYVFRKPHELRGIAFSASA